LAQGASLGPGRSVWLRFADRSDVELPPGVTVVGRSDRCQIVLEDPLISRRHACFVVDAQGVTLKDLGSMNGVLVNGVKVEGTRVLAPGDRITIGSGEAELCLSPARVRHADRAPTQPRVSINSGGVDLENQNVHSDSEPTRKGNILQMLGSVADKAFVLGRGEEAERIVKRPMESLLERALRGGAVDLAEAETAALLGVRLARTTARGAWIDYVFKLYAALNKPPPSTVIDELYATIRYAPKVDITGFRSYIDLMHRNQDGFGPADRFLVRRLEGLDAVLVSSSASA
jgi:pSer/pThr/pTyr-binding forkhead associated (FHA) protein